jgi:hypothetical protein
MQNRFNVQVTWDAEAKMWVADSDDIPGLAAEGADEKSLMEKLTGLIPELLALNQVKVNPNQSIDVALHFRRQNFRREERLQLPNAA